MHHDPTTTIESRDAWESYIAGLLSELSAVQSDLLSVLTHKRTLLAAGDGAALGAMAPQEQDLVMRLQACHDRRQRLLAQAAGEGLPSDSIKSLSKSLPAGSRKRLRGDLDETQKR